MIYPGQSNEVQGKIEFQEFRKVLIAKSPQKQDEADMANLMPFHKNALNDKENSKEDRRTNQSNSQPNQNSIRLLQSIFEKDRKAPQLEKCSLDSLKPHRYKSKSNSQFMKKDDGGSKINKGTKIIRAIGSFKKEESQMHSLILGGKAHNKNTTDVYLKKIISNISHTGGDIPQILKVYIKKVRNKSDSYQLSKKHLNRRQSLPIISGPITPTAKQCTSLSNSGAHLIDNKRFNIRKINLLTGDHSLCNIDFYISQINGNERNNVKQVLPGIFMHDQQMLANHNLPNKNKVLMTPSYHQKAEAFTN